MFRATVRKVHALGDVSVTIDGKYGTKSLIRMKSRVAVDVGERVFVEDVSPLPNRAHDWVLFGRLTEIGQWATPAPHTHPLGQVTGLVDWLSKYETWMGDHEKLMADADKRIKAGADAVADTREILAGTRTDLADAVKRIAVQEVFADKAGARLDQAERDIRAGGDRISANEAALLDAKNRLTSAETAVQKTTKDLTAVDTRLTNTSKDLTALQGTVGNVSAAVADSDQKASDALTKAGVAQQSADGKNTITRSTSPASQPGKAVGDTHFTMSSMGGGGVVTRQQRWDGSTWQDESVGHQVLASLDLGKATVGELDGAYIKANSILSNRVVVSAGENLIPDPTFLSDAMNTSRITGTAWRIGTAASGAKVLTTNSTTQSDVPLTGAPDGWMQVDSTAKYQLQMLAGGPDQLSVYLMLLFVDGTAKADGLQSVRGLTGSLSPKLVEWDLAALGGPVAVRPMIRRNPTPSGSTNYWQQVGAVTFRRKVNTVLIEDGAVTGDKVDAVTVAAKVGQFVKVQAANVEVTRELAARVVNAMTTQTKNLVVTESAVLQHTTLLGTTVADQINVNKLLRGRDAILDGTVDVKQLNVTGGMAANIINASDINARRAFFTEGLTAENATLLGQTVADNLVVADTFAARVVNAMSTNTKRLVVTDDAILNRATVVQSLVTPELIASKVDARYLRADNIKTGLLEVFGRFRTAPDGQPQIIVQPSQSAWNSKDLAVWFTPDGTTPGGGDATNYAVTGGMWMNPAGGGGRSESLWTAQQLNLRGQSRAGVRIMDGLTLQSTAGTVGPTINTQNGQFLNIIGGGGVSLTTLGGDARITPSGGVRIRANNGDVLIESHGDREVRVHAGQEGFRVTDARGGNTYSYGRSTSQGANLHMDGNGIFYKVTSSRRYKKYISDAPIDAEKIMGLRLRKWRDRKQEGLPEDMRYHYGAIAEEVAELLPEFVPTIPDPSAVDNNGEPDPDAPLVPDSIEYDRLGLFVAVTGYQDLRPRVDKLEERLAALEGK